MSQFDLNSFLASPLLSVVDSCRKDDLAQIAIHFGLIVPKSVLKRALKALVISKLVQVKLVKIPVQTASTAVEDVNLGGEARRLQLEGTPPPLTLMWRVALPLVKRQR